MTVGINSPILVIDIYDIAGQSTTSTDPNGMKTTST